MRGGAPSQDSRSQPSTSASSAAGCRGSPPCRSSSACRSCRFRGDGRPVAAAVIAPAADPGTWVTTHERRDNGQRPHPDDIGHLDVLRPVAERCEPDRVLRRGDGRRHRQDRRGDRRRRQQSADRRHGPWIFGKKVLLPAGVVDRVDLDTETVFVNRTKDEIKNAPEFDNDELRDDEAYRSRVGGYYGGI